jgi:hypothetical protein
MAQKFLSIKNFEKYQHYKQRNPPWVKLHLELLDDVDFLRMPDASKWHYVGLILLASRHENAIQADEEYIKNRLGLTSVLDTSPRFIREHVLARKASKPLAIKIDLGGSEKSRVETEAEKSRVEDAPPSPPKIVSPKRVPTTFPETFAFTKEMKEWALAEGCAEPFAEFQHFRDKAIAEGKLYLDWAAAFRTWIHNHVKWKREKANAKVLQNVR